MCFAIAHIFDLSLVFCALVYERLEGSLCNTVHHPTSVTGSAPGRWCVVESQGREGDTLCGELSVC